VAGEVARVPLVFRFADSVLGIPTMFDVSVYALKKFVVVSVLTSSFRADVSIVVLQTMTAADASAIEVGMLVDVFCSSLYLFFMVIAVVLLGDIPVPAE